MFLTRLVCAVFWTCSSTECLSTQPFIIRCFASHQLPMAGMNGESGLRSLWARIDLPVSAVTVSDPIQQFTNAFQVTNLVVLVHAALLDRLPGFRGESDAVWVESCQPWEDRCLTPCP